MKKCFHKVLDSYWYFDGTNQEEIFKETRGQIRPTVDKDLICLVTDTQIVPIHKGSYIVLGNDGMRILNEDQFKESYEEADELNESDEPVDAS